MRSKRHLTLHLAARMAALVNDRSELLRKAMDRLVAKDFKARVSSGDYADIIPHTCHVDHDPSIHQHMRAY